MRLSIPLLSLCVLGSLPAQVEMISLPVMDPPKSVVQHGEKVFTLLPRAFQRNPMFEMTIKCALTPYGHTVAPATPNTPVYYVLEDAGRQQFGELMDREVPPENLDKMMTRALSANGYLPAEGTGHPPSLLLIYHWGSSYAMDHEGQTANPLLHYLHTRERSELMGEGLYTSPNFAYYARVPYSSPESATQSMNSLYFATVSAYDHESVARGQPLLLWRTYLTANAQGVSMREALPALVLTAGTSFGRETYGSQYVTRRGLRGKVTLAPLLIVQNDVTDDR